MELYIGIVVAIFIAFIVVYKKGHSSGKKAEQFQQLQENTEDAKVSIKRQNKRRDVGIDDVRDGMQKYTRK